MQKLDCPKLYLPQLTITKPSEASIPILITRQDELKMGKSVVFIINDLMQDLGIWTYRYICDEDFDARSCTGIIKALKDVRTKEEPAIVILNPGRCYYFHEEKHALSHKSWEALPRRSLFHPMIMFGEEQNMVDGLTTKKEHVKTGFDKLINNEDFVRKDAGLYVLGLSSGGNTLLDHLNQE